MVIYILTYDRGYHNFTDMIFPAWTAFLAGCRSCRWCVVHLAAGAIGLLLRPWNMTSGNVNVPGTLGIWSWDPWGDCCDDHRWCDDIFGKWMNTARSRSRRFNVMGSCRLSGSCDSCGEARVELLRAVCLACALVMAEDAKGLHIRLKKRGRVGMWRWSCDETIPPCCHGSISRIIMIYFHSSSL